MAPPPEVGRSYLRDELELGTRRESAARLAFHICVWASFVGGAVWSGFGHSRWSTWALAFPVAALLAAAVVDLRRPVHESSSER